MNDVQPWLDWLVYILNTLYGLPGAALVFVFCLALGYAIKANPRAPNAVIPWVVMLASPLMTLLVSEPPAGGATRVWVARQVMVGVVTGACAWAFHNRILKRVSLLDDMETRWTERKEKP